MAGTPKADHFVALAAKAVHDDVKGAIIECGVWRGGLSFIVAKALELQGAEDRKVFLADSFAGIPQPPKTGRFNSQDRGANGITLLHDNSATAVEDDAARFHLDQNRLRFVVGYFNESLPELVAAQPSLRFAVVRLDGDTYFSTMDAITVLYPRLSPGGYLIIDDFVDWAGCRHAVYDYRRRHRIAAPITFIPHPCAPSTNAEDQDNCLTTYGAYWRKPLSSGSDRQGQGPDCVGKDSGGVRAAGSYLPTLARLMPERPPLGGGLYIKSKLWEAIRAESQTRREDLWYCAPRHNETRHR